MASVRVIILIVCLINALRLIEARPLSRNGTAFDLNSGLVVETAAPQPVEVFRERFGSHNFGGRRIKRSPVQPPHRARYTTTRFTPVLSVFKHPRIGSEEMHTQLWSPVNNFKRYDRFQARSVRHHEQDTADLLASSTLVGVDERVINVIERFPVDCSQRVLCRIGRNMVEASPLQALFLYNFESNVFGYRDEGSQRAIRAALNGEDCESLFKGCPGGFV